MNIQLPYDSTQPFNTYAKRALYEAVKEVFGHSRVTLVHTPDAPLTFGATAPSVKAITMADNEASLHRELVKAIRAALPRQPVTPWLGVIPDDKVLYLDIETREAELMWDISIQDFFRLGQWAWGPTGECQITTDLGILLTVIEQAEAIVAHNGHPFDFSVLLGDRAFELGMAGRLFDTMVFANQAYQAPRVFSMRDGSLVYTSKNPAAVAKWLGLDNLAYQLGLDGKEGDLKALAKKYGGFGLIPTDDPEFVAYARGDISLLQHVTTELVTIHTPTEYDWREQLKATIDAQMSRNGVNIDQAGAHQRIQELTERKAEILHDLSEQYGFPTKGKMPWRTNVGKQAILSILDSYGIRPDDFDPTVWPQLKTGPSLGGQVLLDITKNTDAADLGEVLAELQGQRWLAQTALDHAHSDGLCHPSVTGWQRSGRRSVRNPGLTIWGERNPRDKRYIIAKPGNLLLECDFSNADQRIVAAFSQDPEYAKRFLPGADGHEISGRLMYGDAIYDSDPAKYRFIAKALSHAYSFGAGPRKLALTSKQPLDLAQRFVNAMRSAYPQVTRWQNLVREQATRGFVVNHWGRRIPVDRGEEYTQAPAMHGQSGTTEVVYDGLIRLAREHPYLIKHLICLVHDALLFDLPEHMIEQAKLEIRNCLEQRVGNIDFPISFGPPAISWEDARHV